MLHFPRLKSGPHSRHAIVPALPILTAAPVHLPDSESENEGANKRASSGVKYYMIS